MQIDSHVVICFGIAAAFPIFVACFKSHLSFLTPFRSELLRFPNRVYDFRPQCIPLRSIIIIIGLVSAQRLVKGLLHQISSSYKLGANSAPSPNNAKQSTTTLSSKNTESKKKKGSTWCKPAQNVPNLYPNL